MLPLLLLVVVVAVAVVVVVVLEWWRLSEVEPVLAEQPAESEPADSEW